jgi:2OG-Fe(II) oxygenase superfamily
MEHVDVSQLLDFEHLRFRYEPFPIGLAAPVMAEQHYQRLLDHFPDPALFARLDELGKKFGFSEKYNGAKYRAFITEDPVWREFHAWIKSPDFIETVLNALAERHIELGVTPRFTFRRYVTRISKALKQKRPIRLPRKLRSRFEFSMLPADGGHILPHTDSPGKIVTLVISMCRLGEWNEAFGGGTDVNRAKNPHLQFNYLNRQAQFEDMEVLDTYQFRPNQAVVFVKTFNSWHSVRPMTGMGSDLMRRTLTINIEEF